ncbi:MAG: MMPL family transporter [Desulfofustis sp.]|nr:MMPL family transporter [Desulfofustis sp.]
MAGQFGKASRYIEPLIAAILRFRAVVLAGVILCTGLLGWQLQHLTFDTSNEGFLHEDDPYLKTYNQFRDQFGRDDFLVLAVFSEDLFSTKVLEKLRVLHDDLDSSVPFLEDITSLINVRDVRGVGDTLLVEDLVPRTPTTDDALQALRERILNNPLYINNLISENGKYTAILLQSQVYGGVAEEDLLSGFDEPFDADTESAGQPEQNYLSDLENDQFVEAVYEVVARHQDPNFQISAAGPPVNLHAIKVYMQQDAFTFMKLALLVIGFCLFLMFRRASGVILPLMLVALSLVTTVGLMTLLGVSFKLPTTMLPSFILTVGVGASIHVLSLTYQNIRRGMARHDAIISAYGHSGMALLMTSLTTSAGLASFSMAKVAPIADLGIFSAMGVGISLVYTFTFLPATLSLLPLKPVSRQKSQKRTLIDRFLSSVATFSISRYRLVLGVAGIIVVFGLVGVTKVLFSHDGLEWLPEELGVRQATELLDRELKGTVVLEMVLDTGRENGLYDRETLLDMEQLMEELVADYADHEVPIGKTLAISTLLKEIHQALHGNDPAFYIIPENEKLIPQEFLLFTNTGSDDLDNLTDSQYRFARITLKVPWQDALLYIPFISDVTDRFSDTFGHRTLEGGQPMYVTATGIMSLFGRIIYAAMYSAAQSYGIALVVITIMMILLIGNLKLGLISMIPNLAPIITVLGLMGWLAINLDMFTMLIASIVIGLAVDDTIHFMYNFKRYYQHTGDLKEAVENTLMTAGRAMLTTSVVLSFGFFIFIFAAMNNLFYFGLLAGSAVLLALGADLLLAPALMTLVINKGKSKQMLDSS